VPVYVGSHRDWNYPRCRLSDIFDLNPRRVRVPVAFDPQYANGHREIRSVDRADLGSLHPLAKFSDRLPSHSPAAFDHHDPENRPDGRVVDSDIPRDLEAPDPEHPTCRFHHNARVGAKWGGAKELQLLIDSPSKSNRQLSQLGLGPGVEFDRVQAQMRSLARISSAGVPFTRPERMSPTRRLSSAITRGG